MHSSIGIRVKQKNRLFFPHSNLVNLYGRPNIFMTLIHFSFSLNANKAFQILLQIPSHRSCSWAHLWPISTRVPSTYKCIVSRSSEPILLFIFAVCLPVCLFAGTSHSRCTYTRRRRRCRDLISKVETKTFKGVWFLGRDFTRIAFVGGEGRERFCCCCSLT